MHRTRPDGVLRHVQSMVHPQPRPPLDVSSSLEATLSLISESSSSTVVESLSESDSSEEESQLRCLRLFLAILILGISANK